MEEKGYTVKDVAAVMGFQYPQAVYRWLKGETLPSVDNLLILGRLLDVEIEDLLVIREEKIGKNKHCS